MNKVDIIKAFTNHAVHFQMKKRPYHMAKLIGQNGEISPLCAIKPRPLNLEKELWTIRWEAVTCRKCLALKEHKEIPE